MIASTMKSQRGRGGGGIGPEETLVAAPLTKGSATGAGVNQPGRRQEDDVNIVVTRDVAGTLTKNYGKQPDNSDTNLGPNIVAFHPTGGGAKGLSVGELAPGIGFGNGGQPAVSEATGVRRLTPRECERLQGLPDDWTRLDDKTPDSRRYSALGDAVTANVSEWIGHRLNDIQAREPEAASPPGRAVS